MMNDLGYPTRITYKLATSDYGWIKSAADVARFLEACKLPWFRVACELAFYAGLRQGEVAGLRWDRIDLDRGLITVDRSYDGPTKSKHVRAVPLAPELAIRLKRWRLATRGTTQRRARGDRDADAGEGGKPAGEAIGGAAVRHGEAHASCVQDCGRRAGDLSPAPAHVRVAPRRAGGAADRRRRARPCGPEDHGSVRARRHRIARPRSRGCLDVNLGTLGHGSCRSRLAHRVHTSDPGGQSPALPN